MVSVRQWDESLDRLRRHGQSGGLGKNAPKEQTEDEINRRIQRLEDQVELLIRHQRQGPDWEKTFAVRYDETDVNGHVIVNHDLGYTPNAFVVVNQANAIAGTTVPANLGGIRFVEADASTVTFQIDSDGTGGNQQIYVVIPFRTSFIPVNFESAIGQLLFGEAGNVTSEAPPRGVYTP